jgi:hypothetical protein
MMPEVRGVARDAELEDYLVAVSTALGDVDDRDELMEELRDHLVEVRQDNPGAALVAVIGEPSAYADEMRVASGLAVGRRGGMTRLRRAGARARTGVAPVLRDLRAAWWGLRGLAQGVFLVVVVDVALPAPYPRDVVSGWGYQLAPTTALTVITRWWGNAYPMTLMVLLIVGGIIGSVALGSVIARRLTPPWLDALVIAVGALLALWFVGVTWDVLTAAVFARFTETHPITDF